MFAKRIAFTCIATVFTAHSFSQSPAIPDKLFPAQKAAMNGFVGEKLQASYQNRILAQDVDRLIAPFKNRTEASCWQSEFWGKWFTSAVLAYRYHPDPKLKAILDKAVTGLIQTQTPDGYIGNYAEAKRMDQWDIWGRKYCMLGLIAYYDLTNNAQSLDAAKKVADHLMQELQSKNAILVKKGNHRGMAASSVLEPITQLYTRTKDKRYLNFAEEIIREWETTDGPQLISKAGTDVSQRFPKPQNWFSWDQGQKAYEMMSCYEGLLELYRITGKPQYKEAVEKTWANINETEINIAGSGSSVECWFGGKQLQTMPIAHYQETCVTATWIKLSQQLLRLTGETKYADAIEQTYYNALLGSMKPDGSDWAKYSPLAGQRLEGGDQCNMGLNCCVASGPRGLFTLPLTAVMSEKDGARVNFFVDGDYHVQIPGGQSIDITQQTDYPVSGNVKLKLSSTQNEPFTVRIRIPAWSKQSSIIINGNFFSNAPAGQYLEIKRNWKAGDVVDLTLDMRAHLVQMGETQKSVAIVRGPVVLARDARLGGANVDEAAKPVLNKDGYLDLESAGLNSKGTWMQFKAPFILESHKEGPNKPVSLLLCDYASAGNTYDERSRFRIWIPQLFDPTK
ncbi:MAG: beta-L-arabinofuranosidase domain-containing protein [Bacteroidota bacterium]